MRLVYIDNAGIIKGQTACQSLTCETNTNEMLFFFDYLTLPQGHYRVLPVVQFEGESTWICAYQSGYYDAWYIPSSDCENITEIWPDNDWGFDVIDGTDKLMVRDMWCPDVCYPGHYQFFNYKNINEEFQINFILTNNSLKAVKGTLIAKHERGFSEKYQEHRPSDKCTIPGFVMDEWSFEVGRMDVTIPAGARNWENEMTCKVDRVTFRNMMDGCIRLYFQPEGSSDMYMLLKDWAPILNARQTDPSNIKFWGANVVGILVKE